MTASPGARSEPCHPPRGAPPGSANMAAGAMGSATAPPPAACPCLAGRVLGPWAGAGVPSGMGPDLAPGPGADPTCSAGEFFHLCNTNGSSAQRVGFLRLCTSSSCLIRGEKWSTKYLLLEGNCQLELDPIFICFVSTNFIMRRSMGMLSKYIYLKNPSEDNLFGHKHILSPVF